jgi:hypothetical protein
MEPATPEKQVYKSTLTTQLDGVNHAVMILSEKKMTPRGLRKVLEKIAKGLK